MRARTGTEKVGVSREIAAIVAAARATKAQRPRASKGEARDLVRATRAAEAVRPYEAMEAAAAPAAEPHRGGNTKAHRLSGSLERIGNSGGEH